MIPYSPFECAVTRPKLNAMRYLYGVGSNFITGAPPEFEYLLTLRLCMKPKYNDPNCVILKWGFIQSDLPDPILGAAFIKKLARMLKKIAKKVPCVFFKIGVRGPTQKLGQGADAPPLSPPPRQFCQFPSHRKLTPLASNARHLHVTRAILASQWHGGNTGACHCEAGITIRAFP